MVIGKKVHGKKRPSENEEGGKNIHIRAERSSTYQLIYSPGI